jgi:hypothetical protein
VTTEVAHSGNHALHVIAAGAGSTFANVRQSLATKDMMSSQTYTLSFYFLALRPGTVNFNITSTFRSGSTTEPPIDVTPILVTPGLANTSAALLPAYDSVWLNEIQPDNATGAADGFGE